MFEICIKAFLIPTKLVYGNPLKLQMFLLMFIILSESKVEVFFIKVLNYLHKKMGKGFSVSLNCKSKGMSPHQSLFESLLVFRPEQFFIDPMVDKVPGKNLFPSSFPVNIKIRVHIHGAVGLRPVSPETVGSQQ